VVGHFLIEVPAKCGQPYLRINDPDKEDPMKPSTSNSSSRASAREIAALAASMTMIFGCVCRAPATPTPDLPNCLNRAVFGDPAQSPYVLPYLVGSAYPVLQAYCTSGSHSNQLAYDFRMAIGTPVVAAREGVVVDIVDAYEDTDLDRSHFNYIMIRHDDNTTAFYAHVQHLSIAVQLNESVGAGQLIANSGSAGTPVADLHFGVYRTWPIHDGDDVAVNFRNAQGTLDPRGGLQQGVAYLALAY
jgi:murein DD-endopeptidase MepM/ murein hydrolase activator NlpD